MNAEQTDMVFVERLWTALRCCVLRMGLIEHQKARLPRVSEGAWSIYKSQSATTLLSP